MGEIIPERKLPRAATKNKNLNADQNHSHKPKSARKKAKKFFAGRGNSEIEGSELAKLMPRRAAADLRENKISEPIGEAT
jgi:hypothetical protein